MDLNNFPLFIPEAKKDLKSCILQEGKNVLTLVGLQKCKPKIIILAYHSYIKCVREFDKYIVSLNDNILED